MMRTRRNLILAAVAAIGVIGAWLAWSIARNRGRSDEHALVSIKVRLKWLHQAQFAGFYVAKEKGYYQAEGLDVTLNPGGVDFPAVQMVVGGGEDFGVTAADQILLAREKQVPVVALAVIFRESPMVYFSLKSSGITKPQDFVGKRVGVKLGGNEELTYRAMMRRAGIDMKKIQEIPVKYDMSPLFTGQVDVWPGYAINEPIVAEEQGHQVNIVWPSAYGVSLYADALFATETTIQDRPDVVERFVRATLKGWEYAIQHPDEAVEYTLRYSDQLKRDHELRMMRASIPLLKPDDKPVGWMDASKWLEMEALLREQGFMKDSVAVNSVFTTGFLPSGNTVPQ